MFPLRQPCICLDPGSEKLAGGLVEGMIDQVNFLGHHIFLKNQYSAGPHGQGVACFACRGKGLAATTWLKLQGQRTSPVHG